MTDITREAIEWAERQLLRHGERGIVDITYALRNALDEAERKIEAQRYAESVLHMERDAAVNRGSEAECERNELASKLDAKRESYEAMSEAYDKVRAERDAAIARAAELQRVSDGDTSEPSELPRYEHETLECAQIVGAALDDGNPPAALHIGHLPDMCRDLVQLYRAAIARAEAAEKEANLTTPPPQELEDVGVLYHRNGQTRISARLGQGQPVVLRSHAEQWIKHYAYHARALERDLANTLAIRDAAAVLNEQASKGFKVLLTMLKKEQLKGGQQVAEQWLSDYAALAKEGGNGSAD